MTQDSNPSAKAAQQIATKAATEIVGRFRTDLMFHKFYQVGMNKQLEGSVDGIAEIIEQAISDSLRPYKEALLKIQRECNDSGERDFEEFAGDIQEIAVAALEGNRCLGCGELDTHAGDCPLLENNVWKGDSP